MIGAKTRSTWFVAAAVVGGLAWGCGGDEAGGPGGGGPAGFGPQPRVVPSGIDGSLGVTLGERPEDVASGHPGRVVQAVAGEAHVCVLDDAGAAWCWGDQAAHTTPSGDRSRWPLAPRRVEGVPERLSILFGARDSTCGTTLEGGLWCWGWAAFGLPEVGEFTRARRIFAPPDQFAAVVHVEGPWSFARVCASDGQGQVRCARPGGEATFTFPGRVGDVSVDASELYALVGSTLYRVPLASGDGPASPVPELPGFVALSRVGAMSCGLTAAGEGHCWPGVLGSAPEATFVLPGATALAGGCALDGAGAVRCGLPDVAGPPCGLDLLRAQAFGDRGCGPRADGSWVCFGRAYTAEPLVLDGFTDHARCPAGA